MSLRIFSGAILLIALTACGSESAKPEGEKIACAIGAGADLMEVCTLEMAGEEFVIHHPDGGFRRFLVKGSPHDLKIADGAEPSTVDFDESTGRISASAAGDRYVFNLSQISKPDGE